MRSFACADQDLLLPRLHGYIPHADALKTHYAVPLPTIVLLEDTAYLVNIKHHTRMRPAPAFLATPARLCWFDYRARLYGLCEHQKRTCYAYMLAHYTIN